MDLGRPNWRAILRTAALAATLLAVGVALSGCKPASAVDQSAATEIATRFAFDSQPPGTQIRNERVTEVQDAGAAWRVSVSFEAVIPGDVASAPLPIHLIIDVDKVTGVAGIFAQG